MTNTGKFHLRTRRDIHWERKLWHMIGVASMAFIYMKTPTIVWASMLVVTWASAVSLDFLRQRNKELNHKLMHFFGPFMREHEIHRWAGTTALLTGVLLVALIFPKPVVLPTLLFLGFADPIASYFGIRFGRTKILSGKSLEGTLAAFFVCGIAMSISLKFFGIELSHSSLFVLLAALCGALAELIPIAKLDDNFTLPTLSAISLWILFLVFGLSLPLFSM